MPPNRRQLLQGLGAVGLAGCAPAKAPPPLTGGWADEGRMARGHRVREPLTGREAILDGIVDVVIVGAGVSGLAAAWRLAARPELRVAWLELSDRIGGTAASAPSDRGAHPTGAHYVTVPSLEHAAMRRLLTELGVLAGSPPTTDPRARCLAPQERLFVDGVWEQGLWPTRRASEQDDRHRAAFAARIEDFTQRMGADGLPAFSLPVWHASVDPTLRALAGVSFETWLDDQGFDSPLLRQWLRYCVRDDFGTELSTTSAWAGLHYQAARRPWVAHPERLGTEVLTWPGGNGWLVEQLAARLPYTPTTGAVVRAVEPDTGRVFYEHGGSLHQLDAQHVVLAVPQQVADRLTGERREGLPDAAPWWVCSLWVDALPQSRGVSTAWDSVLLEGEGLGYVTNSHQSASYGGPSVLTWYRPLSELPVGEARRALAQLSWEEAQDQVLRELSPAHPDLRTVVRKLEGWRWGHGTVRPVVGLHTPGRLQALAAPSGRVHRAHTDLSGMSLFEEALFHGVRAAEEVLGDEETWLS